MRRASPQILVLFLLFTLALASALWFVAREEQRRKERLLVPTPGGAGGSPAAEPAGGAGVPPAEEPSVEPVPPPAEPALSESEAAERALWLCREAESALLAQDYATAEARALDSLTLQPKAAATLRLLGHVYVCQGRPADALPALSEALRVEPLHPQALCDLSLAHFMQRNIPAALEAVDTCLRVHPNYPGALLQRGMLLLTVPDRCDEAADVLRQALVAFPGNLAARNNLAIALIRAAKYDEAVAELDAVLEADPANYTALYHHAAIHIFQNDLPSAIPWLRRALQAANPDQQRAILGDPDLDPVRRDPLFLSLLDEFDPAHSIRISP